MLYFWTMPSTIVFFLYGNIIWLGLALLLSDFFIIERVEIFGVFIQDSICYFFCGCIVNVQKVRHDIPEL